MSASALRLRVLLGLFVAALLVMATANGTSSYAAAGVPAIVASGAANPPAAAPTAIPKPKATAVLLAGCAAAANLTPATAAADDLTNAAAGETKIGVAIALSGAAGAYGASQRKGLLLAQDEINKAGGVDGHTLGLLIEDTASDKTQASTVFQNFIEEDQVLAILGPTLSSEAAAADPLAQAASVPVIGMSNTGNGITEIGDYVFRDSLSEADAIPNTVAVMKNSLNIKNVAIMYAQDDKFSSDGYGVFKTELAKNGINILDTEVFNTADTSFDAYLTKIQGLSPAPDAIVVTSLLGPASKIIVKARDMGLNQQIIGGNGFNTPLLITLTGKSAEGAIFGGAWSCSSTDTTNQAFIKAYVARWQQAPDQFSAQAYSALKILADAIHRAKSNSDTAALRDALAATAGLATPLGSFTFDSGRNAKQQTFIQEIKGGQFVLVAAK
jgi:branched-chain amino acid transport system substrate-binding protein